MLAGEQQQWRDPATPQGIRDRGKLDGFGAGADRQRDWSGQSSS
jgi:hypothetical protein